jgi:hypothetical protein
MRALNFDQTIADFRPALDPHKIELSCEIVFSSIVRLMETKFLRPPMTLFKNPSDCSTLFDMVSPADPLLPAHKDLIDLMFEEPCENRDFARAEVAQK